MELFETPGNPLPPGAIVAPIRTRDGLKLRTARWSVGDSRGTVFVGIGRSEFIEEYSEVIAGLLARRFEVVVMDWRGQGLSDRETRWIRRGYVSDFKAYRYDLEALEQQILRPIAIRPWFALGHSMGAAVLLDQAHDEASPFERLVLSAPMIDLKLRRKTAIRRLVKLVDRLGLGALMIPGGSEASLFLTRPFEDNILTTDRRQYERLKTATTELPKLAIGAPTIRWLACAFDMMRRFEKPRYPIEVSKPILVVAAGDDAIVDTAAIERFAINLKAGRCITIAGARHQVIMERDDLTAQFWAAFDSFVPGEPSPFEAHRPSLKRPRAGLQKLVAGLAALAGRSRRQRVRSPAR